MEQGFQMAGLCRPSSGRGVCNESILISQVNRRRDDAVRGSPVPALQALLRLPIEDLVFERARLEEIFLEHYRPEPRP